MSIAPSSFRRRIRRASSMEGPQSFWGRLLETISRSEVLVRLGLCLLAAFFLLVLLRGWSQPFAFRLGSVAPRGVVSELHLKNLISHELVQHSNGQRHKFGLFTFRTDRPWFVFVTD